MSDYSLEQKSIQSAWSANQTVTDFAQATITAIPSLDGLPAWFAPIEKNIKTAQAHAQNWVNVVCPAVTSTIPQSITDFSETFSAAYEQLNEIFYNIENNSGGKPTSAQRAAVDVQMGIIVKGAAKQAAASETVTKQVKEYFNQVTADQTQLGKDLATVASHNDNGSIRKMQVAIGTNFLNTKRLGPCSVIVMVDINISIQVNGMDLPPEVITAVYGEGILKSLQSNVQMGQKNMQNVYDGWSILHSKFGTLRSDLKEASDDTYVSGFKADDLSAANDDWQHLAEFVSTLTN